MLVIAGMSSALVRLLVIGYSRAVGKKSHLEPRSSFASLMNEYTWHLAKLEGWDRSGRQMEAKVGGEDDPKRSYWLKVLNNLQSMTTQDVALIAAHFGVSAYDYVESARQWDESGRPSKGHRPHVGPHPEDYDISEDPGEFGLAAKQVPTPGN